MGVLVLPSLGVFELQVQFDNFKIRRSLPDGRHKPQPPTFAKVRVPPPLARWTGSSAGCAQLATAAAAAVDSLRQMAHNPGLLTAASPKPSLPLHPARGSGSEALSARAVMESFARHARHLASAEERAAFSDLGGVDQLVRLLGGARAPGKSGGWDLLSAKGKAATMSSRAGAGAPAAPTLSPPPSSWPDVALQQNAAAALAVVCSDCPQACKRLERVGGVGVLVAAVRREQDNTNLNRGASLLLVQLCGTAAACAHLVALGGLGLAAKQLDRFVDCSDHVTDNYLWLLTNIFNEGNDGGRSHARTGLPAAVLQHRHVTEALVRVLQKTGNFHIMKHALALLTALAVGTERENEEAKTNDAGRAGAGTTGFGQPLATVTPAGKRSAGGAGHLQGPALSGVSVSTDLTRPPAAPACPPPAAARPILRRDVMRRITEAGGKQALARAEELLGGGHRLSDDALLLCQWFKNRVQSAPNCCRGAVLAIYRPSTSRSAGVGASVSGARSRALTALDVEVQAHYMRSLSSLGFELDSRSAFDRELTSHAARRKIREFLNDDRRGGGGGGGCGPDDVRIIFYSGAGDAATGDWVDFKDPGAVVSLPELLQIWASSSACLRGAMLFVVSDSTHSFQLVDQARRLRPHSVVLQCAQIGAAGGGSAESAATTALLRRSAFLLQWLAGIAAQKVPNKILLDMAESEVRPACYWPPNFPPERRLISVEHPPLKIPVLDSL